MPVHPAWWIAALLAPSVLDRIPGLEALMPSKQKGELKLSKAQLKLQEMMFKGQQEAAKMTVKESRKRSDEMIETMLGLRREERGEARRTHALDLLAGKQSQETSLMNNIIQAAMQMSTPRPVGPPRQLTSGLVGLLRR